ncbi:hypothetical protein N9242_05090, partial [Vicingaceae bacterium]|nr:hypothetical protein [Vicingaceae bacterium]
AIIVFIFEMIGQLFNLIFESKPKRKIVKESHSKRESLSVESTLQVPSFVIQTLESFNNVLVTKNLDTFKSRFEFLIERLNKLKKLENKLDFSDFIDNGLFSYGEMYPNRQLCNDSLLVKTPSLMLSTVQKNHSFYLLQVAIRHCDDETEKMNNLKRVSAKIKRIEKLITYFENIQEELNSMSGKDSNEYQLANKNLTDLKTNLKILKE